MRELAPKPHCLVCGTLMSLKTKKNIYHYSCNQCLFGNSFQTKKILLCPICFSDVLVVREQHIRVTLCSNFSCPGYQEGERGNYRFRTIKHLCFNNYLDWHSYKNYFRVLSVVVGLDYHNYLVKIANNIVDSQKWKWKTVPEFRKY